MREIINWYAKLYESIGSKIWEAKSKMINRDRTIKHVNIKVIMHRKDIVQVDAPKGSRTLGVGLTLILS